MTAKVKLIFGLDINEFMQYIFYTSANFPGHYLHRYNRFTIHFGLETSGISYMKDYTAAFFYRNSYKKECLLNSSITL